MALARPTELNHLFQDVAITGPGEGDLLVRGPTHWTDLPAGAAGTVLTAHGAGELPTWEGSLTPEGGPITSFIMVDNADPPQQWEVTITAAGVLVTTRLYVYAPTQVLSLVAVAPSTTAINLTWDYQPGADTYDLEHSTDGATWSALATVTAPGYPHPGLTAGTRHYYRVRAENEHGTGPYSATGDTYTWPAAVGTVTVTPVSGTQLNLSWAHLSPVPTTYLIERSPNGTTGWVTIDFDNPANSYSDTGLSPGTTYYYQVLAHNPGGAGGYSPIANGTTP